MFGNSAFVETPFVPLGGLVGNDKYYSQAGKRWRFTFMGKCNS